MQVVERTVKIPQLQLVEKIVVALDFLTLFVDMPVVCNNRCFGSRSAENCGFAVAFHHGRRHHLRGTDAVHGLCDHGVSPVACGQGGRCPFYAGRAVRTSSIAPCIWQSLVRCSVFAFGVQVSGLFWVITSGKVPVFSAYWFNTGYMSTSVHGGFWNIHTLVFQRNAWFDSGFLLMRQIMEPFTVHTAENCRVSAVAVRSGRRLLFRCAEAVPHGPDY